MTNKIKSKKIGTWHHDKTGIDIDYFLEGTLFKAIVLEETLSAPEASVLRAKVDDKLNHWLTLEWHAVIEIEVEADSGYYRTRVEGDGLTLKIGRYYLSRSPAGDIKRVGWDVDESHRKAKMGNYDDRSLKLTRLPLGAPFQIERENHWLIDYDENAWNALESIIRGIGQLRRNISDLVKSKDGVKKLVSAGAKVLMLSDKS